MLSDRAKVQIDHLRGFLRWRSDHHHAVSVIVMVIQAGYLTSSAELRDVCKELGWNQKAIEELCQLTDTVGFTLLEVGAIERW